MIFKIAGGYAVLVKISPSFGFCLFFWVGTGKYRQICSEKTSLLDSLLNICFFWLNSVFVEKYCRYLAKILVPEGSKDVPVGQPIAITVLLMCFNGFNILTHLYCRWLVLSCFHLDVCFKICAFLVNSTLVVCLFILVRRIWRSLFSCMI